MAKEYSEGYINNSETNLNTVLATLSNIAASAQNPDTVLRTLPGYICEIFKADLVEVFLRTTEKMLRYCWNGVEIVSESYSLEKNNQQILPSPKIIVVNNFDKGPEKTLTPECDRRLKELNVLSFLNIPLQFSGDNIGLINIAKTKPHQWTEQEIEQAEQFATPAGLILRNLQLQIQLEQNDAEKIRRLEKRNHELEIMNEVNKEFRNLENYELNTVIKKTVALVSQAIPTDIITLYLVNTNNSEELILVGGSTVMPTVPNWAKRISIHKGLIGKAARTKKSVLENDIYELMKTEGTVTVEPDPFWRSVLFVPLIWGDKLMGIIGLLSLSANKYTHEQEQFLEVITESIAAALQYAYHMKKLKEQEGLEAALSMARTAAHELSQPLTLLTAELDMILHLGTSPNKDTFIQMHASVNEINNIVREYQRMIRLKTTETMPGMPIIDRETSVDKNAPR